MTGQFIFRKRWFVKGRIVSVTRNLDSLREGGLLTSCERLQLSVIIRRLNRIVDLYPQRSAEILIANHKSQEEFENVTSP